MSAEISYRLHAQLICEPDAPLIRIDRSAFLPCGCTIHVGQRVDDGAPATAAVPHRPGAHRQLLERANRTIRQRRDAGEAVTVEDVAGILDGARRASR